MRKMFPLIVLLLHLSAVYSDSHSLRYYYTGVSALGSGLPELSLVGYVDDQQIESYCSDTKRRVPVALWMKENESHEYWEKKSQNSKANEILLRHEMALLKEKFPHTEGFHFFQGMSSCELRDDGSIASFLQIGYDGEELIYYDNPTGSFIPTMAEAEATTQRWNRQDLGIGKRTKNYLENNCTERLKIFVEYGRADLERRVRPKVKITHRKSGNVTKLHCLVYGFHPRAVDVKWVKNGKDDVPSHESTDMLPNPDGTYHIRVTVEAIPKEGDSYSCYVDHSSLEEPLLVEWEPGQDSPRAVIIGVVVFIVLVLISGIIGIFIHRRRKKYKEVSVSDLSFNADKPP